MLDNNALSENTALFFTTTRKHNHTFHNLFSKTELTFSTASSLCYWVHFGSCDQWTRWHHSSDVYVEMACEQLHSGTCTCKFRSHILYPTKCVPWFVLVCVAHNQSFVWPHLLIYYTCTGMMVLIGRYISIFLDTPSSWWTMGLIESNLGTCSINTCIMKSKCYKCILSEIPVDFWRQHYNNFDPIMPR